MKNLKRSGIFFILIIISLCLLFFESFKTHSENRAFMENGTFDSLQVQNEQLLAFYKKIYADSSYTPSSSFNEGNVSEAQLRDYLTLTETGYIIQLPGSTLVPSPVVYKSRIYLSGGFGSKRYYSFDARTGKDMKAWDLDDDGPSSAAIRDEIIVFNTESCTIFAIDLTTGQQLWSWWLGDPLMCMPTIAGDKVFTAYPGRSDQQAVQYIQSIVESFPESEKNTLEILPDLSHVLAAFDLKTGKVIWQRRIDGDVMSAPIAHDNEIYVTTFSGTFYKFRQSDGELLSVSQMRATSAPVITEEGVLISKRADQEGESVSEEMAVYDKNNILIKDKFNKKYAPYLDKQVQQGSELKSKASEMDAGNGFVGGAPASSGWSKAYDVIGQSNVSSLQSFQGSRTLNYGNRNYSSRGNELICNDPKTGKEIWKVFLSDSADMNRYGGFMGTPPLEAGGYIVIATYSGEILLIQAETGQTAATYDIGDPVRYQPVVEDGWIYVTTVNSRMHAINTNRKELTGWPMWGGNAARTNQSVQN